MYSQYISRVDYDNLRGNLSYLSVFLRVRIVHPSSSLERRQFLSTMSLVLEYQAELANCPKKIELHRPLRFQHFDSIYH